MDDTAVSGTILLGDVVERAQELTPGSIQCVFTSPPYALQRADQYGGVPEDEYPDWTVAWLDALRPALTADASVFINIRAHVTDGELSDYVLRTRLAVRQAGWIECDQLIWHKRSAPPLGDNNRPRRAWEPVLWFSPSRRPFCDPRANGRQSDRIGFQGSKHGHAGGWIRQERSHTITSGRATGTDVCHIHMHAGEYANDLRHPAPFPESLPAWFIRMGTAPGDLVCDPFLGSGTTAVAAIREHRRWVGIERDPAYAQGAWRRIAAEPPPLPLEDHDDQSPATQQPLWS